MTNHFIPDAYASIAVDSLALQAGQADPYAPTSASTIDLVLTYRQHAQHR